MQRSYGLFFDDIIFIPLFKDWNIVNIHYDCEEKSIQYIIHLEQHEGNQIQQCYQIFQYSYSSINFIRLNNDLRQFRDEFKQCNL